MNELEVFGVGISWMKLINNKKKQYILNKKNKNKNKENGVKD